ncbi:AraC family transcriptional regulator [Epibacterium ulvae]|uniref:AraC family transcriptional regulator n=1 Tax=Epibacterium ulvae TaxID=1156985 RepID=UPI002490B87C|nr:GyrI-like domain-containing protein [Epibacterium ulvae]
MSLSHFTQRHRINRVINYARGHIADGLTLEQMSDVACLSKYHFSRVFAAHMMETPAQFVARLRLERAAGALVRTKTTPVTEIALTNGFSGSDIFARAFRKRFGVAPQQFRKLRWSGLDALDQRLAIRAQIYTPGQNVFSTPTQPFDVQIERRPEYHVAYIRHMGPYGDVSASITKTFQRLQQWAKSKGLLTAKTSFLGRGADDCSITPARFCTYDACLILSDFILEDDIVSVQTIPAGEFAVLRVLCGAEQANRYWDWLIGQWLPTSERTLAPQPSYEFFPEKGADTVNPEGGLEICLPVSKRRPQTKFRL